MRKRHPVEGKRDGRGCSVKGHRGLNLFHPMDVSAISPCQRIILASRAICRSSFYLLFANTVGRSLSKCTKLGVFSLDFKLCNAMLGESRKMTEEKPTTFKAFDLWCLETQLRSGRTHILCFALKVPQSTEYTHGHLNAEGLLL